MCLYVSVLQKPSASETHEWHYPQGHIAEEDIVCYKFLRVLKGSYYYDDVLETPYYGFHAKIGETYTDNENEIENIGYVKPLIEWGFNSKTKERERKDVGEPFYCDFEMGCGLFHAYANIKDAVDGMNSYLDATGVRVSYTISTTSGADTDTHSHEEYIQADGYEIIECIIPKGTKYYSGTNGFTSLIGNKADKVKNYGSKSLKYNRIVDKKEYLTCV